MLNGLLDDGTVIELGSGTSTKLFRAPHPRKQVAELSWAVDEHSWAMDEIDAGIRMDES
jgi:hypothetical protein